MQRPGIVKLVHHSRLPSLIRFGVLLQYLLRAFAVRIGAVDRDIGSGFVGLGFEIELELDLVVVRAAPVNGVGAQSGAADVPRLARVGV